MSNYDLTKRQKSNIGSPTEQTQNYTSPNNVRASDTGVRDDRYKQILKKNLGNNGMAIIASLTTLFLIVLIMIMAGMIGFVTTFNQTNPPQGILTINPTTTTANNAAT